MSVVRWVPVSHRFTGHRVEPLIRERLWGNDDPLPKNSAEEQEFWAEAGFDADGRAIAYRERSKHDGADENPIQTVERQADGTVVAQLEDGMVARTSFDDAGRAATTVYTYEDGEESEERYHYDDAGLLVAIDESEALGDSQLATERWDTGGRLTVEHDGDGLSRIAHEGGETVWERPTQTWEARLADAADALTPKYLAALAEAVAEADLPVETETYAVSLVYVDQGTLDAMLNAGLESERRGAGGGEEGAIATLYIDNDPLVLIEAELEDDGRQLLRDACLSQPGDPYRVVLGEVARRLSDAELPGLTKTADFVAFVAEHDEGLAEKVSSIRAHNSADAVARWEAGWGGEVLPFTND